MPDERPRGPESKVERIKRASHQLRGTITEALESGAPRFNGDDATLLKFHGSYQQDDRDQRRTREGEEGKTWQFMVRIGLPGGMHSAAQYLAFDRIAERHGNGTLRITTRQGYQLHGVLMGHLKPSIAEVNAELATTLAACGDVQRNVMACPAPLDDPAHRAVRAAAVDLAAALRPRTRAYHEIWLDGEAVTTSAEEEPFYGTQYLPRKFKTAIALPGDNCVDIYSQDAGLIAITDGGVVVAWNVIVGGGLGMTHGKGDTMAALGSVIGAVAPSHGIEAIRTVAAIYRDHGNRSDRRRARLKYLIAEWGLDRFRDEFVRRFPGTLEPARTLPPSGHHDHLGAHQQGDGRWFYGLHVEAGRIRDAGSVRLRAALAGIARTVAPGFVLTPQQNLLLTGLDDASLARVEDALTAHGVALPARLSPVRRHALACPALPTCSLALAESERALPGVLEVLEEELKRLGLDRNRLTVRLTGCPNGCARPYTADLALVGRSLDLYNVYVGGSLEGNRLADLFLADVKLPDLRERLLPLLEAWSRDGHVGEALGDFYQRIRPPAPERRTLTGREEATAPLVGLAAS